MSDAPEPYDLEFETPAPVARPGPAPAPGLPRSVPARAPGFPQPAPAPAPAPVVMAQRVTTFSDRKPTCAACNQPIADTYYSAGKKIICPQCHAQIMGSGAGATTLRIFKALGIGTAAAILGASGWAYGESLIWKLAMLPCWLASLSALACEWVRVIAGELHTRSWRSS